MYEANRTLLDMMLALSNKETLVKYLVIQPTQPPLPQPNSELKKMLEDYSKRIGSIVLTKIYLIKS